MKIETLNQLALSRAGLSVTPTEKGYQVKAERQPQSGYSPTYQFRFADGSHGMYAEGVVLPVGQRSRWRARELTIIEVYQPMTNTWVDAARITP